MTRTMDPFDIFFEYSDRHRNQVALASLSTIVVIAVVDAVVPPYSLGFLYVIPILIGGSLMRVWQLFVISVMCSFLREQFSPWNWEPGATGRIIVAIFGFALAGYFAMRLNRQRQVVMAESALRTLAEERVRALIETSPLAILTLDADGRIQLANRSAEELFRFEGRSLRGQEVRPLVPTLSLALGSPQTAGLRTTLECNAHRLDGEVFLAHVWLSTYPSGRGLELAAVIWDGSEHLRDRESTGLDSMLAASRVVIGAISHEIRNLANAAMLAHREMQNAEGKQFTERANVLSSVLKAISGIASSGLSIAAPKSEPVTGLSAVLDEVRVLIEPPIREMGGSVIWAVPPNLPLVHADHHGILQVFLNLARNSERAMVGCRTKELVVNGTVDDEKVIISVIDSGKGVANPGELFAPFHSGGKSTGLGLYVSRAMLRAHGGDIRYEPKAGGSCFCIELLRAKTAERLKAEA